MIIAILAAAAVSGQSMHKTIADWSVTCVNNTVVNDGLFDRCEMRKESSGFNVSGVTIIAIRDASGISVTARMKGCSDGDAAPPAIIPNDIVNAPDADKKFIGAQFIAMNSLMKRCRSKTGSALSLGGPEIVELLASTSKIRRVAPNALAN